MKNEVKIYKPWVIMVHVRYKPKCCSEKEAKFEFGGKLNVSNHSMQQV
jgi:hypothetical protein